MIPRYSRPPMAAVWSEENKFKTWLEVELAACQAHVEMGRIPKDAFAEIKKKAAFSIPRILEIEAEIHHDVIAFLTSVAEKIDSPVSRFVHLGLTSSDVVDTSLALLVTEAGENLVQAIDTFMAVLKKQALAHEKTLMMGRTHGVHAEPLPLGLKISLWYSEMARNKKRLEAALVDMKVGKISGAVGNYAHMPPELEERVCKALGLKPADVSNQVLQRDRHATFVTTLAVIAGTLEKVATEIRGLQKTEFNEVLEPFSKKQKGSSAMPHKRNPILCERVTGLARTMRGYALTALENQPLWHERDISHSGAERIILPDATILLDYMFGVMTKVIDGMQVNADQMKENIDRSYRIFFSQQLLLKLVESGMTREVAYRIVQRNAMAAFKERINFDQKIREDAKITDVLNQDELDQIFSMDVYQTHTKTIFKRVFG